MPDGLPDVPAEMMESLGDAVEAPAEPTNQVPVETTATPEGTGQEEAATDAPDSFTRLDPNALPEELRPYYQSMQSDYTRKTQEAAPWRKLSEELGVSSPDDIRQAAELYAYLQGGPQNVHQFYEQLGAALGVQASPTAPASTPAQGPMADEFSDLEDPAFASLKQALEANSREVAGLKEQIAQRDAQAQQEALQWALLGEMNRQEALLKESYPQWGEDEWNAVWNLAPTFNGDLTQAAAIVDATQNAAVTRLLNGKAQVAGTEGLSAPAPPRIATEAAPAVDGEDHELKGATQKALEYLRGVVNMSE